MNKKLLISLPIILIILLGVFAGPKVKNKLFKPVVQNSPAPQFYLVSIDPNPLEGATILPTQSITVTFNKPVRVSELKHRFDPEINHEVTVANGIDSTLGTTLKITFVKPLQLGSGYTFFILASTHTEDKINLDRDYIYHFSTIKYNGV